MANERPNILVLMTDQQRGDCLGIDGHPVLQTPYLDEIATSGTRFTSAYSAVPVCVPARRTFLTGQKASSHGVFANYDTDLPGATLPGELSKAGYQTHLVGKLHMWPKRKLYGFDSADWADNARPNPAIDDYDRFLMEAGIFQNRNAIAHGSPGNGWVVRPFHLQEKYHFTNWCADRAISFLERRDPTVPFFLNVSFHQPHQPLTPPQMYYDRYINMTLPEPVVGDWARVYDTPMRGLSTSSWRVSLEKEQQHQFQAAYYGCINHIDDQIGRILEFLDLSNTVVVFLSDHGEMLGDHQWIRKHNGFESSARVPFLLKMPKSIGRGMVIENPVELMDVMPTLLKAAGLSIPDSVDGSSVLAMLGGEPCEWREYVHGECADVPTTNSGMQYLTDGKRKYIWYPGNGKEHFFDLESDPKEIVSLSSDIAYFDEIKIWRERLVKELRGRPEGFTDGIALTPVGGPTSSHLPEFKRQD